MTASEQLLVFKVGDYNELLAVFLHSNPVKWKQSGRPTGTLTRIQLRDFVQSFLDPKRARRDIGRHWRDELKDCRILSADGSQLDLRRLRILEKKEHLISDQKTLRERFDSMVVAAGFTEDNETPLGSGIRDFLTEVVTAARQGSAQLLRYALSLKDTHEFRTPILLELIRAYRKDRRLNRAQAILDLVLSQNSGDIRLFRRRIALERYWIYLLRPAAPTRSKFCSDQLARVCRGIAVECSKEGFLLMAVDFVTLAALCVERSNEASYQLKLAAFDEALRHALACGQLDRVHGAYFNRSQFLCDAATNTTEKTAGLVQMYQSLTLTGDLQVRTDLFCHSAIARELAGNPEIDPAQIGIDNLSDYIKRLVKSVDMHRNRRREPGIVRTRLLCALRRLALNRDPSQLARCEQSIAEESRLNAWIDAPGRGFAKPDRLDLDLFRKELDESDVDLPFH